MWRTGTSHLAGEKVAQPDSGYRSCNSKRCRTDVVDVKLVEVSDICHPGGWRETGVANPPRQANALLLLPICPIFDRKGPGCVDRMKHSAKVLAWIILAIVGGVGADDSVANSNESQSARWAKAGQQVISASEGSQNVYLFPSASESLRQGFVRVINHSDRAGEVRIEPVDDSGRSFDTIVLSIDANQTIHFNSNDLEGGNAAKGLSGSTGAGQGSWRLAFSSDLDIEVLSYIRTMDGFLTSMHDVAPAGGDVHQVAIFNPGSNRDQESRLRLINPGTETAEVSIRGLDDKGRPGSGEVQLSVDGGTAREISAQQLESGDTNLSGSLGDGAGKWRLEVESEQGIVAMSLLRSKTGHLTNLSTSRRAGGIDEEPVAQTAEEVFRQSISGPIVQSKCVTCHVADGVSGTTRLVFVGEVNPDHQGVNLGVFRGFLAEVDDGASYILQKIQGQLSHGGGVQVEAGSEDYANMDRFLTLLDEEAESAGVTP